MTDTHHSGLFWPQWILRDNRLVVQGNNYAHGGDCIAGAELYKRPDARRRLGL